jgi:nitroimidazol reductase NimA-like FMN-containing flavoprotein (pyridoxamine 5'-phosphate oxidase superfamily)
MTLQSSINIFKAMSDVPGMNQSEVEEFLGNSKLVLRLGAIDRKGEAVIYPVWYYFQNNKLYIFTDKESDKARNLTRNGRVYFTVDTNSEPYKGVRGKGTSTVVEDVSKAEAILEKIIIKYLGGLDDPYAKSLIESAKLGSSSVIEITPDYYTVWDYGKIT